MFPCQFRKNFNNIFFTEHLQWAASEFCETFQRSTSIEHLWTDASI